MATAGWFKMGFFLSLLTLRTCDYCCSLRRPTSRRTRQAMFRYASGVPTFGLAFSFSEEVHRRPEVDNDDTDRQSEEEREGDERVGVFKSGPDERRKA